MFDRSKSVALGAAVLSGVTASVSGSSASAMPLHEISATPGGRYCATRALPKDAIAGGAHPLLHCAGSPTQAAALLGADRTGAEPGLLSTQSVEGVLAFHFINPDLTGGRLDVYGWDCRDTLPWVPEPFASDMSATQLGVCSRTKMFTGYDFTGDHKAYEGNAGDWFSFGRDSVIENNVRSVQYGA